MMKLKPCNKKVIHMSVALNIYLKQGDRRIKKVVILHGHKLMVEFQNHIATPLKFWASPVFYPVIKK